VGIVSGIKQRNFMLFSELSKLIERRQPAELHPITAAELSESGRIVTKPNAKRGTGRHLLHPSSQVCVSFSQTSGPETIDENALPVVHRAGVVNSLYLEAH
jgi:hypothetical protein